MLEVWRLAAEPSAGVGRAAEPGRPGLASQVAVTAPPPPPPPPSPQGTRAGPAGTV